MPYEYYTSGDTYGADAVLSIFGIFYGFFLLIGLLFYILEAVGLYTVAKRRGIRNYGLAWVPIANVWILGSIADQYMFVSTGARKNYRKILLGLNIGLAAMAFVSVVWLFGSVLAEAVRAESDVFTEEMALRVLGSVLLIWLLIMVLAVVLSVFTYIAYYRLFQSCAPYNATLYLVLSIFVGVTLPFFVFACRNKDDGMQPYQPQFSYPPVPPVNGAPPAGPYTSTGMPTQTAPAWTAPPAEAAPSVPAAPTEPLAPPATAAPAQPAEPPEQKSDTTWL